MMMLCITGAIAARGAEIRLERNILTAGEIRQLLDSGGQYCSAGLFTAGKDGWVGFALEPVRDGQGRIARYRAGIAEKSAISVSISPQPITPAASISSFGEITFHLSERDYRASKACLK
jgi:hypothetical protein